MDIYEEISNSLLIGNAEKTDSLVREALGKMYPAEMILEQGLVGGIKKMEEKFQSMSMFVPEALMSARALNIGLENLRPYLKRKNGYKCTAILGTVLGCIVMSLSISIYSQIGLILLIALSAKNAILIIEFAMDYRKQGESIRQSAMEAGRLRLRPILMTSFAFIFGVLPLMFATGAGAESRIALGTAVVFGMAMNTVLGTLFVPNFYELMESVQERWLSKVFKDRGEKGTTDSAD